MRPEGSLKGVLEGARRGVMMGMMVWGLLRRLPLF